MGHTIWVEVQGWPVDETAEDSSMMHRLMNNLDALAEKLGVQKLSEFYDYSELESAYGDFDDGEDIEDEFDEDIETDAEESLPPESSLEERQAKGEWFDAAAGLESVRKLRQQLVTRFDDLGFKPDRTTDHWPRQLMEELSHAEAMLAEAASHSKRFRLLIVP